MDAIKILHLEDNLADAELIRIELEASFPKGEILHVHDRSSFDNALKAETYHIIISDYNVPGLLAMESFEMSALYAPKTPFICVSGAIGEEGAVEMLRTGVTDYVLKNKLEKLPIAIKRALREVHNRKMVVQKELELKASHAFKTSIINTIQSQIIVINEHGEIVESNAAWKHFIATQIPEINQNPNRVLNYWNILQKLISSKTESDWIAEKLKELIAGKATHISHDCEFAASSEKSWFILHATSRLDEKGAVITHSDITNRIQSEITIKKNEQVFRSLAENAPNWIVKIQSDMTIEYINRDVFGLQPNEIIGKQVRELVISSEKENVIERLTNVFETGKASFYHSTRLIQDGSYVHLGANIGPVTNASGAVESLILIVRDMTEEMNNEKRIADQNSELLRIDEINQIGLNQDKTTQDLIQKCIDLFPEILPLNNRRFYLYDATTQGLDLTTEQLDFRHIEILEQSNRLKSAIKNPQSKLESHIQTIINSKQLFISNDPDEILDILDAHQISDEPTSDPATKKRKTQTLILAPLLIKDLVYGLFLLTSKSAIDAAQIATLERFISVTNSVLVKKHSEKSLIENEKRYRNLFENINEGFAKIIADGTIAISNSKFSELLGYTKKECNNNPIGSILQLPDDVLQLMLSSPSQDFDFELQKKSGSRFWAHVSTTAQFSSTGEFLGGTAIIRDISDKKLMEAWQSITANIAKRISAEESTLPAIFEYAQEELGNYMPNINFFAALREENDSIDIIYFQDETDERSIPYSRKSGNGMSEYIIESGQPLWIIGEEIDKFRKENEITSYGPAPKAWIFAPLFIDDVVIGVIGCTSYTAENAFTEFHFEILKYVGKHIGMFIDKIEAQEDRNRILNLSEDLICIVNRTGHLRYSNPAFERLLGYAQEEVLDSQLDDFVYSGEENMNTLFQNKVGQGDQNFNCENQMITKAGQIKYVSWTVISQEKDKLYYCIGHNVSEQRIIQTQIEESERRYRGLFERMNEGIMHSDFDGIITVVNPGICAILGYDKKELIGQCGYDMLHDKETSEYLRTKTTDRQKGIPEFYETEFIRKNGEKVWAQVSATPDYDPSGNFVGIMCIVMDISERKKAELETIAIKEAFTRNLELKVAERTHELENAQKELAISLEKEKELSRLKSRFVSTASHQFRTPLSVIQSNIGILAMQMEGIGVRIKPEEFRPTFDRIYARIKTQIEHMTELMNDVLILGKINEGNIQMRNDHCDLEELCCELLKNFAEITGGDSIQIKVIGTPKKIHIDKQLFLHATSNIVSNAIKYSPVDLVPEITLTYSVVGIDIAVKDQGIGIPEAELKYLFDPFYRASNAKEYSGTGLGTSIAKEYIELMGGRLSVLSVLGEGTEIIIHLNY